MFDKYYDSRQTHHNQIDATGSTFDLWRFQSSKTGKEYEILFEKYNNNVYGVKFYLRSQRKNKNKYSYMTYDGEANIIVRTVIQVILHYIRQYPDSSFVIIGAGNDDEPAANTKRYTLYKQVIRYFVSEAHFCHYDYPERSMYMLLRKNQVNRSLITDTAILKFVDKTFA